MMTRFWILMIVFFCAFGAQDVDAQRRSNPFKGVAGMFYSPPYYSIPTGIEEASRKHALYSYIIANLSTPEFDIIAVLPKDDLARLKLMVPDGKLTRSVVQEFVIARMTENSKRYNAYIGMWKGKKDSLTRIITMGKN